MTHKRQDAIKARKKKDSKIRYIIPAVRKAFAILELFASHNRGYTISEVSRILNIPVSTTSTLLYTMNHCGYLARDNKGYFSLTMKMLTEAHKALNQMELRGVAQPELRKLTKDTGLASVLSIRDGDQLVCIEKIEGTSQIRIASHVGKRFPLHSTCTGKAILAYLADEEVEEIVKSAGLPPSTKNTITSLPALKKELARVRSRGYAVDNEEYTIGIKAVAAPVFDHDGKVVAAIAVGGAVFELKGKMGAIISSVKRGAMEISRKLGYRGGS